MLIILLDRTMEQKLSLSCLFHKNSPYKSSSAVLLALAALIHPSCGDPTRPLAHLNYQVSHRQYALAEFDYAIHNVSVDLRDGVRLTRLVELLLYPTLQPFRLTESTTLTMPSGEVLHMHNNEKFGALSQHLKFPSVGRAPMLYNVQVALGALKYFGGVTQITDDIRPEDIVDGHREKTMALLWALVNSWGLDSLIDWNDLRLEIARLRGSVILQSKDDLEEEDSHSESPNLRYQTTLLYSWARIVAASHGIEVRNLTTSFADGRVFGYIIDEYQDYFSLGDTVDANSSIEEKLKTLGCGSSFGQRLRCSSRLAFTQANAHI
jgi:abnormal spindle-like microcephaly-associated protein